jgi:hypothetical protein
MSFFLFSIPLEGRVKSDPVEILGGFGKAIANSSRKFSIRPVRHFDTL